MAHQKTPVLALVGGFLGAGKTTLILHAAGLLRARGLRVAVITNDQDRGLVDTKLAEAQEFSTREVGGGCFCCRFSDLMEAAAQLLEYQPDVIFAEPVGSCVDISATIMQPLKAYHRDAYRLAPYTVLIDPELARRVYRDEADPDVGFLFQKQIAEADMLCAAKIDRYSSLPELPMPFDFGISALTGQGVDEWLAEVLHSTRVAGARLLDVDYGRYAEAEAALGWLNLHADVELSEALSPGSLAGPVLDRLDQLLTEAGIVIAHLKIFDQAASGYIKAGICANGDEPSPDGDLMASPERRHEIVINLRAIGDPERLQRMVEETLARVNGTVTVRHLGAFRPAAPTPEHRFGTITQALDQ